MNNSGKLADFSNVQNVSKNTGHLSLKRKTNMMHKNLVKWLSMGFFFLSAMVYSSIAEAQCNPEALGSPCVGAPISFKANAAGYTNTSVLWEFGDGTPQSTSNQVDPKFSYPAPGTYTVTFTGVGTFGTCTETISVVVKPSPVIKIQQLRPSDQCFKGNAFMFVDSSEAAPGSKLVRRTIVGEEGFFDESITPEQGDSVEVITIDPRGGTFDFTFELEDANGCVAKKLLPDEITVYPRLGVEFNSNRPVECDSATAILTNLTYTKWLSDSASFIGLENIAQFVWDFGDGNQIYGDSITNTQWWTGLDSNGVVRYTYYTPGIFDGSLTVYADFGCSETFTFKSTATSIELKPRIMADKDSACSDDNRRTFSVPNVDFTQLDGFLWTFGDPPAGPANFNNQDDEPTYAYGLGPWQVSVRMVQGPCDVTAFDSIVILGPGSTIEVPGVRVLESEKYQCVIRDSVHFVNNSGFYHNDKSITDEDSIWYVNARNSMKIIVHQTDSAKTCQFGCDDSTTYSYNGRTQYIWEGQYSGGGDNFEIVEYDSTVVLFVDTFTYADTTFAPDGSIFQIDTITVIEGDTFVLDYTWVVINGDTLTLMANDSVIPVPPPFGLDTFVRINIFPDLTLRNNWYSIDMNGDTTFHEPDTLWTADSSSFYTLSWADSITFRNVIAYDTFEYVFSPGTQSAIDKDLMPPPPRTKNKDHVLRIWDLGDTYAPQCTTDTRINRNVGKNCNFDKDSLPVHWYTPWDDVYQYENDGQFYTGSVRKTLFSKHDRECFQVRVWAFDTLAIPDVVEVSHPNNVLVDSAVFWAFDNENANLFTTTITAPDSFRITVDSIRNANDSVIGIKVPMRWIYVPAGAKIMASDDSAFMRLKDTSIVQYEILDSVEGEGYFAINKDVDYFQTEGTIFHTNLDSIDIRINSVDSMIVGPVLVEIISVVSRINKD
jgi:hypothetical protein